MEYNLTNQNMGMMSEPKKDNDLENLSEATSDFGENQQQHQQQQQNNFDTEVQDNQSVSSYTGSDLSPEETLKKKRLLLFKLKRLQKKNYQPSRFYDMNSSLPELTG